MPWMETVPMDQRIQFIADHRLGLHSATELCARYGISRKTGYKWLDRFEEYGRRGLADRSRAPHHCPHRISAELAALLCATRRKHPDWGGPTDLDDNMMDDEEVHLCCETLGARHVVDK